MKLTFLGTGTSQGVPVIACPCAVCRSVDARDKRLRTSALLTTDLGQNILFDIGPDFRQQMLANGVEKIDTILVTHAHRDHVAGLDDVRPLNYFQSKPMDVYLNSIAAEALRRDYRYIFSPHDYPGLPEVVLHEVDSAFTTCGCEVVPIKVMHKDLPILAYRVGRMAYVTDASHIDTDEELKLNDLELLVVNALRIEKHWSHFCLDEALQLIERVKPRRAFLTHVSHEMGLYDDVRHRLPPNVVLAHDQMTVEI